MPGVWIQVEFHLPATRLLRVHHHLRLEGFYAIIAVAMEHPHRHILQLAYVNRDIFAAMVYPPEIGAIAAKPCGYCSAYAQVPNPPRLRPVR